MFKLFICLLSYFVVNSDANAVSFITPCRIFKNQDKACLLSSAQAAVPHVVAGIPELGIPSLDPLVLPEEKLEEKDLKVVFKDLKIERLKECKFSTIEFVGDTALNFDIECPIIVSGKYNINGKLFIVPIEGEGNFGLKTEKIKITIKALFNIVDDADGKKHLHITTVEKNYEPVEKVFYNFENLFGGDEAKAKPILEVLNQSWKEVLLEIARPVILDIIVRVEDIFRKFFDSVPVTDLYLE